MQITTYRKNIMKTIVPKRTKLAFKVMAKSTNRANIAFAVFSLSSATGDLFKALRSTILGMPPITQNHAEGRESFGNVGYGLIMLSRLLKVKTPTGTKKVKLHGTQSEALLEFYDRTNVLLTTFGESLTGPATKVINKEVVLPKEGGKKEVRPVEIVDREAEDAAEKARCASMTSEVEHLVRLYWTLSFSLFHETPDTILESQFKALEASLPEGYFSEEA